MSEFEHNGVVRLCGKQREFYHVSTCDQVKAILCFNSSGGGGGRRGDFMARPVSHVIMFSAGRFTCKERVMLIECEIRLLLCVNKWCFVTYKHVMRKFNGESQDFHETVISSFSALFIGFRGS